MGNIATVTAFALWGLTMFTACAAVISTTMPKFHLWLVEPFWLAWATVADRRVRSDAKSITSLLESLQSKPADEIRAEVDAAIELGSIALSSQEWEKLGRNPVHLAELGLTLNRVSTTPNLQLLPTN